MPESKRRWTDQRIEVILGNLLRAGVIASALVVLALLLFSLLSGNLV